MDFVPGEILTGASGTVDAEQILAFTGTKGQGQGQGQGQCDIRLVAVLEHLDGVHRFA